MFQALAEDRMGNDGQTAVVLEGWFPACEAHVEIRLLVEEVDLIL